MVVHHDPTYTKFTDQGDRSKLKVRGGKCSFQLKVKVKLRKPVMVHCRLRRLNVMKSRPELEIVTKQQADEYSHLAKSVGKQPHVEGFTSSR